MCATNALAIYLCFALPVAATAPQDMPATFDHYQPAGLNQAAVERLRAGDAATAQILLERAALLAPYEPGIAANLTELKSFREAPLPIVLRRPAEIPSTDERAAKTNGADPALPGAAGPAPLPALWPPRK